MKNKIKWFLFDIGGTIVHLTLINPKGYRVRKIFIPQKEIESLYYTQEYNQYMLGDTTHNKFVQEFLDKKGIDITVSEFNQILKKDIVPTEGMKKLIQDLSKKYQIALATNDGKKFAQYKINGSRIKKYVAKIITSYDLKELKTSVNFFNKALKILRIRPENCVFIDDDINNIKSAESLGIISILFKNTNQLKKELKRLALIN